jgi:formylglycine-generating enzyme required for sulfatase activity
MANTDSIFYKIGKAVRDATTNVVTEESGLPSQSVDGGLTILVGESGPRLAFKYNSIWYDTCSCEPINSLWVPDDVELWLDASDTSTTTFDGSNLVAISDKNSDGTIGSNTFTAYGNIVAGSENGLQTLTFEDDDTTTGTDHIASSALAHSFSTENQIWYFVLKPINIGTDGDGGAAKYDGSFQVNTFTYLAYMEEYSRFYYRNQVLNQIPILPNNEVSILAIQNNWATVGNNGTTSCWIDGVQVGNVNNLQDYNLDTPLESPGNSPWKFMMYNNGQNYLEGEFCEFIASKSLQDRELTEGYLAWKWGIQSKLPENHPYKDNIPVTATDYTPEIATRDSLYDYPSDEIVFILSDGDEFHENLNSQYNVYGYYGEAVYSPRSELQPDYHKITWYKRYDLDGSINENAWLECRTSAGQKNIEVRYIFNVLDSNGLVESITVTDPNYGQYYYRAYDGYYENAIYQNPYNWHWTGGTQHGNGLGYADGNGNATGVDMPGVGRLDANTGNFGYKDNPFVDTSSGRTTEDLEILRKQVLPYRYPRRDRFSDYGFKVGSFDPTQDTDNDGVVDTSDEFPADSTETRDSDSDTVGDNADEFPNDPTETTDTDNDGVGDNADAFPNDPTETTDTDNDGVGDNADEFPNDPTETTDTDSDGVGDNADEFPNDSTETTDTDGDGVGDNADAYPNDPTRSEQETLGETGAYTAPLTLDDTDKELEMIWVEPGTFTRGQDGVSNAVPEHEVTLSNGFYLGKYEVTQAQYEAVMTGNSDGLSATPSKWLNNPNRPVETVSWNDVQVFLTRLNEQQAASLPSGWSYVLPTEAQWEYACRAGTTTFYSWGDTITTDNANYSGSGYSQTRDVGLYSANPWGFFDMHGNVWEWTADWSGSYSSGAVTDPAGPATGSERVLRGGSYAANGIFLRSAARIDNPTNNKTSAQGFRVALKYTEPPVFGETYTTPLTLDAADTDLDMVYVEPDIFLLGSPESEDGRSTDETQHTVNLTSGFYLGKYEVTQAQYEAVMTGNTVTDSDGSVISATPSYFSGNPNRPVEQVSWDDIQVFLTRLNEQQAGNLPDGWAYALPTEAQWEYACRAGTATAYPWGENLTATYVNYKVGQTTDVGSFQATNSWGFFDMIGNVFEWTSDWYATYGSGAVTNPEGPATGSERVMRGGSWNYTVADHYRSAQRSMLHPSYRYDTVGFRLALINTGG